MAGRTRPVLLKQILDKLDEIEQLDNPQLSKIKRDCIRELVNEKLSEKAYQSMEIERLKETVNNLISLFPICTGCDGKINGVRTELCNDNFCSIKCVEQAINYGNKIKDELAEKDKEIEKLNDMLHDSFQGHLLNKLNKAEKILELIKRDINEPDKIWIHLSYYK